VLSPLLFLIAVNDINKKLNYLDTWIFADDTAVAKEAKLIKTAVTHVQAALDEISNWTKAWGFKVSMAKKVAVLFTKPQNAHLANNIKLTYNGQQISIEKEFTFLGVVFDSPNTFKSRVDRTLSRCKNKLNLMKMLSGRRWGCSKLSMLKMYRLLYGTTATQNEPSSLDRLNQVQYKALMMACNAIRGTALTALQVHCGEKPLKLHGREQMVKYVARVKHYHKPANQKVLEYHWTDSKNKHISPKVINNLFWSAGGQQMLECRAPSQMPPWAIPKPRTDTSMLYRMHKNDSNSTLFLKIKEFVTVPCTVGLHIDAVVSYDGKRPLVCTFETFKRMR